MNAHERKEVEIASGTVGDPLQDQKSDILKQVDKRMFQWPLQTVGVRSNIKNKVMRENVLTPNTQGSLCWVRQTRVSELEVHEPSVHDQDLSVPARDVGNVSRILDFHDASIQNKCADLENVHVFVDESSHPSWTELPDEFGDLQQHELQKKSLFNVIQKLIMEHSEEILNVKWLENSSPSWTTSVSSLDQEIEWAKAKVFVYAVSVLCLGQMNESMEAKARWEGQVEGLLMYPFLPRSSWN